MNDFWGMYLDIVSKMIDLYRTFDHNKNEIEKCDLYISMKEFRDYCYRNAIHTAIKKESK